MSVSRPDVDGGGDFGAAREGGATFAACPDHVGIGDRRDGLQMSSQSGAKIVVFDLFKLLVAGDERAGYKCSCILLLMISKID